MKAVAERMSSEERLWAAIRLERTERVPILPTLIAEPAGALAGHTQAEIAADSHLAVRSFFEVFDAHGGWDNPYPCAAAPIQLQASASQPMKMRIPGKQLGENDSFQVHEEEILGPEDYDKIHEMGFESFYYEDFLWRITELAPEDLPGTLEKLVSGFERFVEGCAERGVRPFFVGNSLHPFFSLSLMRALVPFTQDLYYRPDPVERALARMTDDLIPSRIAMVKQSGIDLWLLTEERASGFFYPPAVFERFWWPYTRRIVEAMWDEGIVTVFHLDQCWDKNLAYFRELPRGSAILELDSTTDIFAAKRILGDHLCLRGDVPAAMLAIGSPQETADYCAKLIDEVGKGGGFILGSGCSVPANVKPENFRAMIETGKTREPSAA